MKKNSWKWINIAAFAAAITVNLLANVLPLGGKTTGEVAMSYSNLFAPAPYTFTIWGVIYLLMAFFILYQWGLIGPYGDGEAAGRAVGPWFTVSCAFNIAWVFLWHYERIGLSVLAITGLLISLLLIEMRTESFRDTFFEHLAVRAFFDVYFGWIIAAAIVNISVFLSASGWGYFGMPQEFWTVIALLAGAVIGAGAVYYKKKMLIGLSVLWAYAGILMQHISEKGFNNAYPFAVIAAIVGIMLIFTAIILKSNLKYYEPGRIDPYSGFYYH